jgi:DNA-binding LytR/AlgR family response regulator
VVALLSFLIAAGFLLFLVPEPRRIAQAAQGAAPTGEPAFPEVAASSLHHAASEELRSLSIGPRIAPAPLGGLGQPRAAPVTRLPVEAADGTHFIDAAEVRSIKADAHYTLVRDGNRERMSPWSISEAESQLDPGRFLRVHRSYIVSIPHVSLIRKEGDGAVVELDGTPPHRVPVSRARIAELKARLGIAKRVVPTQFARG